MPKIIDICGNDAVKNTGTKDLKRLGEVVKYVLAKEGQKFANETEFKTEANWNTAKQNKDVIVMYDVETVEDTSTEDTYEDTRTNKIRTKNGRPSASFKHNTDVCSYGAIKSIEHSVYTRIFEITSKGYVIGVANSDGSIQGRKMKNFIVPQLKRATSEASESVTVEVIYKSAMDIVDNPAIVSPSFDIEELEGIYDIELEIVSASATEIVVKAKAGCCGLDVSSFSGTDWKLLTTAGATQSITADSHANGQYTLTGTGWVTGTLELNGVISQPGIMYETPVKATVTIS